jgi:hypothetical protein
MSKEPNTLRYQTVDAMARAVLGAHAKSVHLA